MTTTTRPPSPAGSGAPAPGDEPELDFSIAEIPRRIYAFFYNKKVGLFLILLMGVLTLLGTLFPQLPDSMRNHPDGVSAWLESVRPRYKGLTDLLHLLGVFQMFSSWIFKITTVALALSILACTCHRFPTLWKQATNPHTHVKPTFFTRAALHDSTVVDSTPQALLKRTQQRLKLVGFRTVVDPAGDGYALYGDRFRWSPMGSIIAHIGFIVILAGVFVTSNAGFRIDALNVPVGGSAEIGHGTGLTVQAKDFTDTYQPDGRPADYASDIVVLKNGQPVKEQVIRVNTPLGYDGVSINQASFGIAAQVTVARSDGGTQTETVPLLYQTPDGAESYGYFTLAGSDVQVYVAAPASGVQGSTIKPGQVRVELYAPQSNQPMTRKVLDPGKPAQLSDLSITFDRETRYTGLMVSKDPGAWLVWVGSALIMIGTCLSMFLRRHRLWVRISPAADGGSVFQIASPDRHDSVFERRVRELVVSLHDNSSKEQQHA